MHPKLSNDSENLEKSANNQREMGWVCVCRWRPGGTRRTPKPNHPSPFAR